MTRKTIAILMLALAASAMAIQAQSLTQNSYYLRSLELKALSKESFDAVEAWWLAGSSSCGA